VGDLAQQADGAVLVRENETVVLVAVTADKAPRPGTDFFR
jgi:polyribonucleotide nucleotidyltransferase